MIDLPTGKEREHAVNESEWLDTDNPEPLLAFLKGEAVILVDCVPAEEREAMRRHLFGLDSGRKKRLVACSFARHIWPRP